MTTAYNRIDRFLRKHLNDDNYSSYKDELDAICQAKMQHTWVGLTDEELEKYHDLRWWSARELAREVENKLKERNT